MTAPAQDSKSIHVKELPLFRLQAEKILVNSSGSFSSGTISISQRTSASKDIRISVHIACLGSPIGLMEACMVKEIRPDKASRGIEIKTPFSKEAIKAEQKLSIRISVSFPSSITSLSCSLPHFLCTFKGALRLHTVSVQKVRSIIIDDTLHCHRFSAATSGAISGRFVTATGLSARTVHGDIKIDARLSEPHRHKSDVDSIRLRSQNGKVTALVTSIPRESIHRVHIDASTSKRPIKLNTNGLFAPVLQLSTNTINSSTTVMLPRGFAGDFAARVEDNKPIVQLRHSDDRSVQMRMSREGAFAKTWGSVGLDEDGTVPKGNVNVVVQGGRATLIL